MRTVSKKTLLLFFLPGAIFMFVFLLLPILKMLYDSFFTVDLVGIRTFIGLNNYTKAFTSNKFIQPLCNTLIYIAVAVSVEFVLGLLMALLFNYQYPGSKLIRSLVLSPLMIAPIVAGLTWKFMLSSQFGIINQILTQFHIIRNPNDILWLADAHYSLLSCCIADIWLTTPFMMLLILAGLNGLDNSMLEAAHIDGANRLQQIFQIMIPNIKPVIFTALSIRIVDAARTFDIVWVMTQGGPSFSSELLSVTIYKTLARYNNVGYASAMAIVFVIMLISFTLIFMQNLWNPQKRKQNS